MQITILALLAAIIFPIAEQAGGNGKENHDFQQQGGINQLEWLLGSWENISPGGNYTESWKRLCDTVYNGGSWFVRGNDTLSSEQVTLEQRAGELFYIPVVKDQNQGNPVMFRLSGVASKSFRFENSNHDFPQVISYTQINSDSLVAEISGSENGKNRSELFPMRRKR